MFNWLKNKAEGVAIEAAAKDIQAYINALKGMSDNEMALVVAGAQGMRALMEDFNVIGPRLFYATMTSEELILEQVKFQKVVKKFESDRQFTEFNNTLCWMHSLRAINLLQVRYLGKEMWTNLARGFSSAEEAFVYLKSMGSQYPDRAIHELKFVPPYLAS